MQILLCIDHGPLRSAIARGAASVGFAVRGVATIDEAISDAGRSAIDLLVLALLHPRAGRSTAVHRLAEALPGTTILSLHDGPGIAADESGTQAAIRRILGSGLLVRLAGELQAAAQSPSLRFGELELQPGPCRALHGGDDLRLTPREYRILEHLALRRDQVVSTGELLRGISQTDPAASSNVIAQWVSRVRGKLRTHGAGDMIQTRRGFGYCFAPG